MMNATQPSAAIYCRTATVGQGGDDPLDVQERLRRDYATAHGYTVAEGDVYREVAGGADLRGWPQLDALRTAVQAGEVRAVVAHTPDRLARDRAALALLVAEWREAGAEALTVEGPGVPLGELFAKLRDTEFAGW
jgi:DNA invertase Pin-like site-specific DNA recombinase